MSASTSPRPASETGWRPSHNPWLVTLVVTSAAFMEVLDTTIVNVALPHIAGSLSAGQDESTWTLTSYLVANGIVLPISGWFMNIFGRKRYFTSCILLFTISSLLCGLATSLPELIVFRVMQGFFGAGLQPCQQAILIDIFPPKDRGRAFSLVAIATVAAPAIGPTLGGWLTDTYDWRWIFLVNVPVGIVAWLLTMRLVEDPPTARPAAERGMRPRIDLIGLGLISLGFGCLQVMLDKGEQYDWLYSDFIKAFAVLSVIGLVGAVVWLMTRREPLVNLRVFRHRSFAVGNLLIFLLGATLYASAVLIPMLAQSVLGYTATWAGLVLSPGALVVILALPVVAAMMKYVAARPLIVTGFAVLAASMLYSAQLTPTVDFQTLVLMRIAQTVGIAFLFAPISAAATAPLGPTESNDGAALLTMSRNLGGSIGISVSTTLLSNRTQERQAYLSENLSNFSQPYRDLVAERTQALINLGHTAAEAQQMAVGSIYQTLQQQAAVLAYIDVFRYCAVAALIAMIASFLLRGGHVKLGAGAH